jgi:hypothetical protein
MGRAIPVQFGRPGPAPPAEPQQDMVGRRPTSSFRRVWRTHCTGTVTVTVTVATTRAATRARATRRMTVSDLPSVTGAIVTRDAVTVRS